MSDTNESGDVPVERRIHIGNISPKIVKDITSFETRLSKFGKLKSNLDVHTKPIQDFYFGFINMELNDKDYDKLKNAFNGINYMGHKLTISIAKRSNFDKEWKKDHDRPDTNKSERIKRQKIAEVRSKRITESQTPYTINSINGNLAIATPAPNLSSLGYTKSNHTFNNITGNVKQSIPTTNLKGLESYASDTTSKKLINQQYSKISGNGETIIGRHRKTPRGRIYNVKKLQSMRININGELKQIKCYKTKIWGMDQTKTLKDLTWSYSNGVWKGGDDHIIERVSQRKVDLNNVNLISCGINGTAASNYGNETTTPIIEYDGDDEEEKLKQERLKNNAVLASLFNKYDFDKPLEIEEDTKIDENDITFDSKGRKVVKRYDYEAEGKLNNEDEEKEQQDEDMESDGSFDYSAIQNYKKQAESNFKPEQYYDEDDEGNELDLDTIGEKFTTEAIRESYDQSHNIETENTDEKIESNQEQSEESEAQVEDENETEEPIQRQIDDNSEEENLTPSFGKPTTNNTETLRSLFNPNQASDPSKEANTGFKLSLDDDEDIEQNESNILSEQQQKDLLKQIKLKQRQDQQDDESVVATSTRNKFGLFWPHFDSPFLQTLSQLNKIGNINENVKLPGDEDDITVAENNDDVEENPYEKWFWSKRGELMRECKRRKRDVNRIFKKKNTKAVL